MIDINFKYKNKDNIIQCNRVNTIKDICNKFITENALDEDNIYFVYNGIKINLEQNLFLEKIFEEWNGNVGNNQQYLEILVLEEYSFIIEFNYNSKISNLKVKISEKIRDVFQRFAGEINIDIHQIYFLYKGEIFSFNNCNNKTVGDIANNFDKNRKVMNIIVVDNENSNPSNSANSLKDDEEIINSNNDLDTNFKIEDNLVDSEKIKHSDSSFCIKKSFYFKYILIIFIQHFLIFLFTLFGFIFDIKNETKTIYDKFICIVTIIFLFSFFSILFLGKYKQSSFMIIFILLYPIIVIYSIFLLSKYIKYEYIIYALCFSLIEIFIIIFQVIIWKEFLICAFSLTSFILFFPFIFIYYIFFSDNGALIFYFIIFTIFYFTLNNTISEKFYQYDDIYFSVILFDYGIVLGFAYVIKLRLNNLINIIKGRIDNTQFKIFGILSGQYFIIFIFVFMSFFFKWNADIKKDKITFCRIMIINTAINFVLCFFGYLNFPSKSQKKDEIDNNILNIHHIFYMPMMIIYYIAFSYWINEKYIFCFVNLISIDLYTITLYINAYRKYSWAIILFICSIVNFVIVLLIHLFLLKNAEKALKILLISFVPVIYLIIVSSILKRFENFNDNNYLFAFNYGLFALIPMLIYLALYLIVCSFVLFLYSLCCRD